jgi:hypothetical protein
MQASLNSRKEVLQKIIPYISRDGIAIDGTMYFPAEKAVLLK